MILGSWEFEDLGVALKLEKLHDRYSTAFYMRP